MHSARSISAQTAPACLVRQARSSARPSQAFTAQPVPSRRQRISLPSLKISSVVARSSSAEVATDDSFIAVLRPEDLPKGVRKEVRVQGKSVLIFWYRNEIYAIEARSPAEGAYSEGFIRSKFTQDFCIECPTTGTLFSLKDGSIVSWYPSNPVLRLLTPQDTCRKLEIYPVRVTAEAIAVDVSGEGRRGNNVSKGGSDTSLENNNVYGIEPRVYVEEAEGEEGAGGGVAQIATTVVGLLAVSSVMAVGAAVLRYLTS